MAYSEGNRSENGATRPGRPGRLGLAAQLHGGPHQYDQRGAQLAASDVRAARHRVQGARLAEKVREEAQITLDESARREPEQ